MSKYKILILLTAIIFLGAACAKKEESTVFNQTNDDIDKYLQQADEERAKIQYPQEAIDIRQGTMVTLQTSMGAIELELYNWDAPKTVENFVKLVEKGFYDGVTFHRVIPGFMIQGGDPLSKDANPDNDGTGGPGYMFEDELNPETQSYKTGYKKGVLAMANAGKNTNGSQFFIMLADYALAHDYTIFGRVTAGQDTVDKIGAVPTTGSPTDRPVEKVVIKKAMVEKAE